MFTLGDPRINGDWINESQPSQWKECNVVKEGEKLKVNGNEVLATVSTSNGIIYVIDNVLLPPQ